MTVPLARPGQEILEGPERHGSERIWRLRLADGMRAILGELLPELAREESLRRRYVRDAERLARLAASCVAPTLAIGPTPDPRDPTAPPPWRLRVDPLGESLEAWLARRAPAPAAEAAELLARLADALAEVHAGGAVLRDLQPRQVILGDDGRLWLAEVGLARVDLLSTRTASSLILEGSPYASPEHLRATRVDARSDLYSLGVILWRALSGTLPFGDGPAILQGAFGPSLGRAERASPRKRGGAFGPSLGRAERASPRKRALPVLPAPPALAALAARLLADKPEERPDSARETAALLRGEARPEKALARAVCQGCGAENPSGLRLCLACGKAAVQLLHAPEGAREARAVDLLKLNDEAAVLKPLRELLEAVGRPPLPRLDFLIGDARYYSKEEKEGLVKLPARLFAGLEPETANALRARLKEMGLSVEVRDPAADRRKKRRGKWLLATLPLWVIPGVVLASPLFILPPIVQLMVALRFMLGPRDPSLRPVLRLREGPAALPAADPLVLRLSRLLERAQPDVREQVAAIAVCVQALVEREKDIGATLPVEPIVSLVEKQVDALAALDRELATLDEGAIVRALAASEARREARSARLPLLEGLDRLRSLEDLRAAHMQRLLETSSLLRRAAARVEADPVAEAMQLLDEELPA